MIDAKIYHDGSNYIAIPQQQGFSKPKTKTIDEEIIITQTTKTQANTEEKVVNDKSIDTDTANLISPVKTTKSKLFNDLYNQSIKMKKDERKAFILDNIKKYFRSMELAEIFVDKKFESKRKSLINKRVRFFRKATLNDFNYFVTITYDDKLHTPESFKKKLKTCLGHLHSRNGWTYMGVFEESENNRLHFHGLFNIPTMVGELFGKKDYNLRTHTMQTTTQNTFFNKKFGRCDFESIDNKDLRFGITIQYILKYISKSTDKILYSRGLPTYLRSLIYEDDVICEMENDDYNKLILFKDFDLWDYEGENYGNATPENKVKFGSNT